MRHVYLLLDYPDSRAAITELVEDVKYWIPELRATITRRFANRYEHTKHTIIVSRNEEGVYEGDRADRLLFPFPLAEGQRWSSDRETQWRVKSLDASVEVPAGEFTHCLCIASSSGLDTGASVDRFYAPGVGLVLQHYSDEARATELRLTWHNIPLELFVLHAGDAFEPAVRPLVSRLQGEGVLVDARMYQFSNAAEFLACAARGFATGAKGVLIVSPEVIGMDLSSEAYERAIARPVRHPS